MEAVILAGGKGTRLKPYTTTLPKPLVPVGENPILSIVLTQLRAAGVHRVTLAVNHMAELIMSFFGSGEKFNLKIAYSIESMPLGTVGPLKLLEGLPENFIVMNGDILTDLNYVDLYRAHMRSGALLTIATYRREVPIDFGVLQIDSNTHQLSGFLEKPTYNFDVSMGVYVFNRAILDRVPPKVAYGLDQLVLDMLNSKDRINAYPFSGYWLDLGRPDDFDQANRDIDAVPALRSFKTCNGQSR
jgi:NDP-sugar pyrophosphorylase family protein